MNHRRDLPARRPHETFVFEHWGSNYTIGLGRDMTGEVQEVFINTGKTGTQMEVLARDSAVLLSIALQYGVPIEVMSRAITRDADDKPSGPIGQLLEKISDEQSALARAVERLG